MKRIFVYGTLKRGWGNNALLRHATFIREAQTTPNYRLSGFGIPFLWHGESTVIGEVYEVDDETLRAVDGLEGHPRWYKRQPVEIVGMEDQEIEAYFLDHDTNIYEGDIHEFGRRT